MICKEAVLDPFADRHINMLVGGLIGRYGYTESDRNDLRQGFRLKLLERKPEYDPAKKWEAFVVMVCKNHRATLLVHRLADKRTPYREAKCESPHEDRQPRTLTDQWELQEDTRAVLAEMPPMMRKACEILMRDPKRRIATELGISHGSAYGLLDRALQRFERAHMRDYL